MPPQEFWKGPNAWILVVTSFFTPYWQENRKRWKSAVHICSSVAVVFLLPSQSNQQITVKYIFFQWLVTLTRAEGINSKQLIIHFSQERSNIVFATGGSWLWQAFAWWVKNRCSQDGERRKNSWNLGALCSCTWNPAQAIAEAHCTRGHRQLGCSTRIVYYSWRHYKQLKDNCPDIFLWHI